MSLTTISGTVITPFASTATAASQDANPYNQLVVMMANENQRVEAERAKSALAIEVIAKSMLALTTETKKGIAIQAAEIVTLKAALTKVESQNKIVHAQKDAQITANTELVKAANSKADLLQKQIDTLQKARSIEKFNTSLALLKGDVSKQASKPIWNDDFAPANTKILAQTITLLTSIKHGDPICQKLENDIKAHQKTPVSIPFFFSTESELSWSVTNLNLLERILLLQPLLVPA